MHDPLQEHEHHVRDISLTQGLVLTPLVAIMIVLGVVPRVVGDVSSQSASQYVSAANVVNGSGS